MSAQPLAHSAPIDPVGTEVTRFLTTLDTANASGCAGNFCASFIAEVFDDLNGVPGGTVRATIIDFNTNQFHFIQCSGPEYANSLFVSSGNGRATVNATLDPSSPNCSFFFNVLAPVTLNITGLADGTFHTTRQGTFRQEINNGGIFVGQFESFQFSDTFSGTIGSAFGPFQGFVRSDRNSQRERVR